MTSFVAETTAAALFEAVSEVDPGRGDRASMPLHRALLRLTKKTNHNTCTCSLCQFPMCEVSQSVCDFFEQHVFFH